MSEQLGASLRSVTAEYDRLIARVKGPYLALQAALVEERFHEVEFGRLAFEKGEILVDTDGALEWHTVANCSLEVLAEHLRDLPRLEAAAVEQRRAKIRALEEAMEPKPEVREAP